MLYRYGYWDVVDLCGFGGQWRKGEMRLLVVELSMDYKGNGVV